MCRLLQGDVGAGKTAVAAAALFVAALNGYQGAIMAPTELLAEQHARSISAMLEPFGIRTVLLTGSLKQRERTMGRAAIESGEAMVAIGTHALIQEDVHFQRLGLVIVDEQHRFGVEQRDLLRQKGYHPHMLVMTATPIPRTLALTLYGDLDVSTIDQLPPVARPLSHAGAPEHAGQKPTHSSPTRSPMDTRPLSSAPSSKNPRRWPSKPPPVNTNA